MITDNLKSVDKTHKALTESQAKIYNLREKSIHI